jgi:HSP20 family protein
MLLRFDPFRELDRAFDDLARLTRSPGMPMDAVRHGDRVFMSFDLPGVDPDAIDVTVERNVLTVRAERPGTHQDGDQVLADERPKGTFTRRILLGDSLDTSGLEAAYDHGVLTVTIPVAAEAQPRKIAVGHRQAIEAESVETGSVEAKAVEAESVES